MKILTNVLMVMMIMSFTANAGNIVPGVPTQADRDALAPHSTPPPPAAPVVLTPHAPPPLSEAGKAIEPAAVTTVTPVSEEGTGNTEKTDMLQAKPSEPQKSEKNKNKKTKNKTAAETRHEKLLQEEKIAALKAELQAENDKKAMEHPVELATQRPSESAMENGKVVYPYMPSAIYMLYGAPYKTIDLQLQQGEQLTGDVMAGDTVRWIVSTADSGSDKAQTTHVLIKPIQAGLETNFLIFTNKRSYQLKAKSTRNYYTPMIGWTYPAEEQKRQHEVKQAEEPLAGGDSVISSINFDYKIDADDDYPWTPIRVFDDGTKTYIQMSPKMKVTEAPALFIVGDKSEGSGLNLVNYRVKGDYYIVDRLFKSAMLKVGKSESVEVINLAKGI